MIMATLFLMKFILGDNMTDFNLENLDALIMKGRELKKLLTETPEILTYLRLVKENGNETFLPKVDDVLIRSGEAAAILGVNKSVISHFVKTGQLRGYFVGEASHLKFWRSEVKALAKPARLGVS